jgi:hypothetical protein
MSDAEDEAAEAGYDHSFAMLGELGRNGATNGPLLKCQGITPRWDEDTTERDDAAAADYRAGVPVKEIKRVRRIDSFSLYRVLHGRFVPLRQKRRRA